MIRRLEQSFDSVDEFVDQLSQAHESWVRACNLPDRLSFSPEAFALILGSGEVPACMSRPAYRKLLRRLDPAPESSDYRGIPAVRDQELIGLSYSAEFRNG